jgi:hypothetical protein
VDNKALLPQGINSDCHPFLQHLLPNLVDNTEHYLFESRINAHYPEFVPDHLIYGYPVIAGAGYLSTALQFAKEHLGWSYCQITQVEFIEVLVLTKDNALTRLYTQAEPNDKGYRLSIYSQAITQDSPVLNVSMQLIEIDGLTNSSGALMIWPA